MRNALRAQAGRYHEVRGNRITFIPIPMFTRAFECKLEVDGAVINGI